MGFEPFWSESLKTQIERVQRRATRGILKQRVGVMSYRDRLLTMTLLPLTFDREIRITLTYSIPVPGQLYDPAPAIPSFLASFKFGVFWLIVF